eukprot:scaffold12816_cov64-Phaeocystis_antarctica.AAC.3
MAPRLARHRYECALHAQPGRRAHLAQARQGGARLPSRPRALPARAPRPRPAPKVQVRVRAVTAQQAGRRGGSSRHAASMRLDAATWARRAALELNGRPGREYRVPRLVGF